MIVYKPFPIIFSINDFHLYSFSLILSLGIMITYFVGLREVKRIGLDPDFYTKLAICGLIGSFVGARLFHIVQSYQDYLNNLPELLSPKGGSSIGGMVGAFICTIMYSAIKKKSLLKYADAVAPALALGFFLIRIGCFLNWDDYGTRCDLPWGVFVDDFPRHPTQLYESLICLVLAINLFKLRKRERYDGWLFLNFVLSYGVMRFLIEFLRDSNRYWMELTSTQIALFFIIISTVGHMFSKKGYVLPKQ